MKHGDICVDVDGYVFLYLKSNKGGKPQEIVITEGGYMALDKLESIRIEDHYTGVDSEVVVNLFDAVKNGFEYE